MKRWQNLIAQLVLSTGQVVNVASQDGLIKDGRVKDSLTVGMGIAQLAISMLAHKYNTDGTPQEVAYRTQK